jgi:hypothetical protein
LKVTFVAFVPWRSPSWLKTGSPGQRIATTCDAARTQTTDVRGGTKLTKMVQIHEDFQDRAGSRCLSR